MCDVCDDWTRLRRGQLNHQPMYFAPRDEPRRFELVLGRRVSRRHEIKNDTPPALVLPLGGHAGLPKGPNLLLRAVETNFELKVRAADSNH